MTDKFAEASTPVLEAWLRNNAAILGQYDQQSEAAEMQLHLNHMKMTGLELMRRKGPMPTDRDVARP